MALERIEPGVFEPAELAIRESIVLPYIARQEALFLQTGYRFNDDSGPHETFSCIQQDIRTLYAEPAGKLALSEVLWQRGSIHPETGDITWEFRNPERGERLASRLESILGPADEPVLPHIEKVAQNEAAQNSRLKNSTATRIVRALQRVWTHYGALEEEYRAGQTNLPFIEYLLDSRASRIPEIWYLKWQKEERHTTMTYVPKAAPEAPAVDDQPEAEPEQIIISVSTPQPDLAVITKAIAGLPEQAAEVLRCYFSVCQDRQSHREFSALLGTNSRDATMRLAAAFQEAAACLTPIEYTALTAIRYL